MPLPKTMRAVEITEFGEPEVLQWVERPMPVCGAGEVLIAVKAAGVNRGDTLQRRGFYPPPEGVSDIPGLEVAGEIVALGSEVTEWRVGDRVCALLAGGGYASFALAPAAQCLAVPEHFDWRQAAGLPETLFTSWMTLVDEGHLQAGQTVLIHGGSSGVGTMAIEVAKSLGARVIVTAGSESKCQACRDLGADLAINYRNEDFVLQIEKAFGKNAVNIALDMVGADYVSRNMQVMAMDGRMISIAILGGMDATVSIATLLFKRLTLVGTTLRGRSLAEKAQLASAIREHAMLKVIAGAITPRIHASFPMRQAAEAHRLIEAGGHIGKIVLTLDD